MVHQVVPYCASMSALKTTQSGVEIAVWVVPGSSRTAIRGMHGDRLKVTVAAPAEDGRANRAVADLLAATLGMEVSLGAGMRGRAKVFLVPKADVEAVRRKLGI